MIKIWECIIEDKPSYSIFKQNRCLFMKKQIQRIQQLIDNLPKGKIRKELFKKLLKLKTKI